MVSNDRLIHSELSLPNERNCKKMTNLYDEGAKTRSQRNTSECGVVRVRVACLLPLPSHLSHAERVSSSDSTSCCQHSFRATLFAL